MNFYVAHVFPVFPPVFLSPPTRLFSEFLYLDKTFSRNLLLFLYSQTLCSPRLRLLLPNCLEHGHTFCTQPPDCFLTWPILHSVFQDCGAAPESAGPHPQQLQARHPHPPAALRPHQQRIHHCPLHQHPHTPHPSAYLRPADHAAHLGFLS